MPLPARKRPRHKKSTSQRANNHIHTMVLHSHLARSAALLLVACGLGAAETADSAAGSAPGASTGAADIPNVTGKLGDAASITNNPPGRYRAGWMATPSNPFSGSIEAISSPNGKGVIFLVNLENLPAQGGPFSELPCPPFFLILAIKYPIHESHPTDALTPKIKRLSHTRPASAR